MKTTVNRKSFILKLQVLSTASDTGSIEVDSSGIVMESFGFDKMLSTSLQSQNNTPGKVWVDLKKMTQILKTLECEDIILKFNNNNLKIKGGTSNFNLFVKQEQCRWEEEPYDCKITLNQDDFKNCIKKVYCAAPRDNLSCSSPMNGVFIKLVNDGVEFVATDGKRLATSVMTASHNYEDMSATIPLVAARNIDKVISGEGEVELKFNSNMISIGTYSTRMVARLRESVYPDYNKVLDKISSDISININRESFLTTLKRVATVISNPANEAVKTEINNGKIILSAQSSSFGSSKEDIDCSYTGEKKEFSFNHLFLLDPFMSTNSNSLNMKLGNNDNTPVSIITENYKYLLMPMRGI